MTVAPGPARLAVPLALALLLAGCTADPEPAAAGEQTAPPFADCAVLTAAPPSAAPASSASGPAVSASGPAASGPAALASGPAAGGGLPDLELPCFTGGQTVRLADVRGPAVVNLWASWCEPCRTELPVMQDLADRAGGRLHVLGVNTGDDREAAASFGAAKSVTMPTVFDQRKALQSALGGFALPMTIFVDPAGRDYVHTRPLDASGLAELVREHTGVAVAP